MPNLKQLNLYFVRHGQTQYNIERRLQGHADSALTETGITQAKAVGRGLAGINFLAAYSSDSQRVIDTAKHALQSREIPLITDPRLKEMSFGVLETLVQDEIKEQHGDILEKLFSLEDLHFSVPQGESYVELFARTKEAIDELTERHVHEGGNILVFSHGVTIGNYLMQAHKLKQYPIHENCSVSVVRYAAGQYSLDLLADTTFRDEGKKLLC